MDECSTMAALRRILPVASLVRDSIEHLQSPQPHESAQNFLFLQNTCFESDCSCSLMGASRLSIKHLYYGRRFWSPFGSWKIPSYSSDNTSSLWSLVYLGRSISVSTSPPRLLHPLNSPLDCNNNTDTLFQKQELAKGYEDNAALL